MVMTIVLHPLSHYNSITEPCTRFLLSFLEGLTIDFPSHFSFSYHVDSPPFLCLLSQVSSFFSYVFHRHCYR